MGHTRSRNGVGQSLRHELKLIGRDLPPSWDGETVRWSRWKSGPELIICPTPPLTEIACNQCGVVDATKSLLCWGQRMETGHQENRVLRQLPSGRTYWLNTTRPATWVRDLVAYRCPHCKHDRVWGQTNRPVVGLRRVRLFERGVLRAGSKIVLEISGDLFRNHASAGAAKSC